MIFRELETFYAKAKERQILISATYLVTGVPFVDEEMEMEVEETPSEYEYDGENEYDHPSTRMILVAEDKLEGVLIACLWPFSD